ncbi:IS110 family transposase [Puniceibacterium antarcticum]|nr:transposase [Puniceibacterium antarcticum]
MKYTIGIDISKDTLDAHRLINNEARQFANSPVGLRVLRRWIGVETPDLVAYEATGAYHAALECHFAGILPLVKVNPRQARRFAQARGRRAKTDAVDAHVLAKMGSALDLVPDAPTDKNEPALKELQIARPQSGKLSAALLFLYFSGGRDRTMTWDIHRNEKRLC